MGGCETDDHGRPTCWGVSPDLTCGEGRASGVRLNKCSSRKTVGKSLICVFLGMSTVSKTRSFWKACKTLLGLNSLSKGHKFVLTASSNSATSYRPKQARSGPIAKQRLSCMIQLNFLCKLKSLCSKGDLCMISRDPGGKAHKVPTVPQGDGFRWANSAWQISPVRSVHWQGLWGSHTARSCTSSYMTATGT